MEIIDNAPVIDLVIQVMGDGESCSAKTITSFPMSDSGRGQAELFHMVFETYCRYMNMGGSLTSLARLLQGLAQMSRDFHVEYPKGWELLSVLMDVKEPTFIMTNEKTGRALVVVEDERTELMNIADLPELIE